LIARATTKIGRARHLKTEDAMAVSLAMTVNGKPVSAEVDARTLLVDFLRNHLALTGTHVGCDTAQCGACTVHLDGRAVKSCNVLALQAQNASVVTIRCRRRFAIATGCNAVSARRAW
jgi:xanthine dehydrogenase iron-sulfur cluster and FAD-binding subunit A